MSTCEKSITIPADCIANVFGEFDSHVKRIEKTMKVTMIVREDQLRSYVGKPDYGTKCKLCVIFIRGA